MTAGIMFCMAYVFVFAKAYQQRNVIHNNWLAIPVFSFMMAFLKLNCNTPLNSSSRHAGT